MLVDGGIIRVRFPYNPDLVQQIRGFCEAHSVPRRWVPETKEWLVPTGLLMQLKGRFPSFAVQMREAVPGLISHLPDLTQPLPDGRVPYAHQRDAVTQMLSSRGKLLAYDMGTGKTLCALLAGLAWARKGGLRVVVVCFANKVQDWKDEAEGAGVPVSVHSWAKVPDADEFHWPYVLVGDESHAIKTMTSKRTKSFLKLADKAQVVYLLTGSPMPNGRPAELFPQLKALRHPITNDRRQYERVYCGGRMIGGRWDSQGATNMKELRTRTLDVVMRKRKEECLDLPKLSRQFVTVTPSKEAVREYQIKFNECYDSYRRRVEAGECSDLAEGLVLLNAVRQAASVAKVEQSIEMIEEIIGERQKVVVFTAFKEAARRISAHFQIEPYTTDSSPGVRTEIYEAFRQGRCPIFCGTGEAGGVGLNLQVASYVILLDRSLTPGMVDQQESRCHRAGQHWPVTSYWMCYGSIDHRVDRVLLGKQEKIDQYLDGHRDSIRRNHLNPWRLLAAAFAEAGRAGSLSCSPEQQPAATAT